MSSKLPPTPVGMPPGHSYWNDWYEKLRNLVNNSQIAVLWNNINFSGSNLTDIVTRSHQNLQDLQGGTPGEYYHLTAAQAAALGSSPAYSVGTFTPTIAGTTTAGVGVYSNQIGKYTVLGNMVHIYMFITWSAHTGTGNLKISGLPFTGQAASGGHTPQQHISVAAANLTYTGDLFGRILGATTDMDLRVYTSAAAGAAVAMDTAATIVVQGFYFT